MTTLMPGENLPAHLRMLITHIVSHLEAVVAAAVDIQTTNALIVRGSSTMVDVEVAESIPSIPLGDGPVPIRAIVYNPAGEPTGEVLVWIRAGRLIGLEQAWYTDEPPPAWPDPEAVRLS